MKRFLFIVIVVLITGYTPLVAQSINEPFGRVEISLHFERQEMPESNQYAVWIQDQDGEVVKTLFVTRYTAQGGSGDELNSLLRWRDRANARFLSKAEVDGFSGATPQSGWQKYIWDGTDRQGNRVPKGRYVFVVESSYNDEERVIYMGMIPTGGQEITVKAKPGYYPDDYDAPGSNMVDNVQATYIPPRR